MINDNGDRDGIEFSNRLAIPLLSFRIAFAKSRYSFLRRSKIAEARNARSERTQELLDSVDNMVRARADDGT